MAETRSSKKEIKEAHKVGKHNLYDIVSIPQGKKKDTFKLFTMSLFGTERIMLKSPPMNLPFGIERYNNKDILNAEFTNNKDNFIYNFYNTVKQVDRFMEKLSTDNDHKFKLTRDNTALLNRIHDKSYVESIKKRPEKFDPLFRLHLKSNKNVYTTKFFSLNKDTQEKKYLQPSSIKGRMCILTIELSSVWTTSDSYGLLWYVDSIRVL